MKQKAFKKLLASVKQLGGTMTRNKVDLMHRISVLYHWASDSDRDTISALSDKQVKLMLENMEKFWAIKDGRRTE